MMDRSILDMAIVRPVVMTTSTIRVAKTPFGSKVLE